MANEFFCYEHAVRKADERRAGKASRGAKISATGPAEHLAPTPLEDRSPPDLIMSGDDFDRAACVEAHARLAKPPINE